MDSSTSLLANSILASFQAAKSIDSTEQQIFQQMINGSDPSLVQILNRYNSDAELGTIELEIFQLIKRKHKPQKVVIPAKSINDEMTSPLGNYLLERKKRNSLDKGVSLSIGEPILIQIQEVHEHQVEDN
ncbi:unnamed protein product [Blepharisma stoltei]|uniref:Uncharacterized protein n=1 Tax=Blepharisma stoltei TaxID=1481888 RepID=A0AAU9K0V6_9CILI|nr:unnamed protein product [Blepharisma stoltei]